MVEKAHLTFKNQLFKQKGGYGTYPTNQLNLALFTLNFLSVDEQGLTAADRFWTPRNNKFALVKWTLMGLWQEPDPVLIWGRGHVCVSLSLLHVLVGS